MHYLYFQALEVARKIRMTENDRMEQLISRVYGNIRIEQPQLTRELVRELVQQYYQQENADAKAIR